MNEDKPLTPKTTPLHPDNELSAGQPELLLPKPKSHLKYLVMTSAVVMVLIILWLVFK